MRGHERRAGEHCLVGVGFPTDPPPVATTATPTATAGHQRWAVRPLRHAPWELTELCEPVTALQNAFLSAKGGG